MVLNTVGASRFGQTLGQTQDAINRVTLSINRATQAAKTGRVSAELQRVAQEKAAASYNLAGARLTAFSAKIQENAHGLNRLQRQQSDLNYDIDRFTRALGNAQAAHQKTINSGRANAGILKAQQNAIGELMVKLQKLRLEQTRNNAQIDKAVEKDKLLQSQLRAREARLAAMKAKMEEVNKPLSRFESFVATLIQVYNTIDKVSRTFDRLTLTISRTLRIVERLKGFLGGGVKPGAGMGYVPPETLRSQDLLVSKLRDSSRQLGLLGQAAAFALGDLAVRAAMSGVNAVLGLGRAALTTVASFERLNISLRAMLAVQATNADASLDMQEAIKLQTGAAAKLVRELERIGILSPFSVEAVKAAFQQGMGMGFAADQALRLTRASLDWAAATGKAGYAVEHVVFVLAQMRSAGKLNYQDMYQLAQLGIGMDQINQALAKSLGKTTAEILRMREAGQITAEQGIEAITQFMEQFQGAAKDQAQTLEGLLNSLGDIGPIFLRNFFGPLDLASGKVQGVLGAIRVQLADFVNFLQQDWVVEIARKIGVGLGDIATKALAWGRNIVMGLAEGIYQGAVALVEALTYIGQLLAYWLSPGSPPRIAPDLDQWGAAAMSEFFKGFGLADISIFKDLSGMLEGVLRSAVISGEGDKVGILERIFGTRQSLAQLADMLRTTGQVTEQMFQNVFAALGGPSLAVQNYLRTFVALEQQNGRVKAAQDKLNAVTKRYEELLKPIDQQLNGITESQQDLMDEQKKFMLQMILDDPNATASEKSMARLELEKINAEKRQRLLTKEAEQAIDSAAKELEAEQTKQAVLAEQLQLQQELIGQETEQNRLLQEYLDLLKRLEDAAGGGGGGGEKKPGQTPKPGGFPNLPDFAEIGMPQFITDLITKITELGTIWGQVWEAITAKLAPAQAALDKIRVAVFDLQGRFLATKQTVLTFVADGLRFLVEQVATSLPTIFTNIATFITQIGIFWTNNHVLILSVVNFAWRVIVTTVTVGMTIMSAILAGGMQVLNGNWAGAWQTVQDTVSSAMTQILAINGVTLDEWLTLWAARIQLWKASVRAGIWDFLTSGFGQLLRDLVTIIYNLWLGITLPFRVGFLILAGIVKIGVLALKAIFTTFRDEVTLVVQGIWDTFSVGFAVWSVLIRGAISIFADLFRGDWQGIVDTLGLMWSTFWEGLTSNVTTNVETILGVIGGLLTKLGELARAVVGAFSGQGFIDQPMPQPPVYNAAGGPVKKNTWSWVGESGPELRYFGSASYVMSSLMSKRLVTGGSVAPVGAARGGGGGSSSVSHGPTYNYSPVYNSTPPSPARDFAIMEVWSR